MNRFLRDLNAYADPARAKVAQRFLKTGKGEYGEGDQFLGVTVPNIRRVAKSHRGAALFEVPSLFKHRYHEVRLLALFILIQQYRRSNTDERARIIQCYLEHMQYVNNWDLVDSSAPYLLGDFLLNKDRSVLLKFAKKNHLWTQRIAIIATLAFVRRGQFHDTLKIAQLLLHHPHDLIHKAVGWMLREIGKRDEHVLTQFLIQHSATMPRTMLRYAIERLPEKKRRAFLRS